MASDDKKKTKTTKEDKKEEVVDTDDEVKDVEKNDEEVEKTDSEATEVTPEEDIVIGGEGQEDKPSDYFAKSQVYADDNSTATVEKKFSGKRLFYFLVVIAVSAGVFFAGLMFFNFQFSSIGLSNPLSEPTPTLTPTPEASPTPEPTVDLSDLNTQVLNGSGVSGAAADVAEILEGEGFEGIEVGNASNQDYEDTEVQLKEGVSSEVYGVISKALSDYSVVEGSELDEDSEFDVIVIVGQTNDSSGDEDEPTPTEAEESEE